MLEFPSSVTTSLILVWCPEYWSRGERASVSSWLLFSWETLIKSPKLFKFLVMLCLFPLGFCRVQGEDIHLNSWCIICSFLFCTSGEALYQNSREVSHSLCSGFTLFTGRTQLFQIRYGEETVKNQCIFGGGVQKGIEQASSLVLCGSIPCAVLRVSLAHSLQCPMVNYLSNTLH